MNTLARAVTGLLERAGVADLPHEARLWWRRRIRGEQPVALDPLWAPEHLHITGAVCPLTSCPLTGFHFHDRGHVYRSLAEFLTSGRAPAASPEPTEQPKETHP